MNNKGISTTMKIKSSIHIIVLASALCGTSLTFAAGGGPTKEAESLGTEKDATSITTKVNKDLLKVLPFSDMEDFKNALDITYWQQNANTCNVSDV